MPAAATRTAPDLRRAIDGIELALPAPGESLDQSEEWVVVSVDGAWRKVRLHDYPAVFSVPGLYEKWVYEILRCASPAKMRALLSRALARLDISPGSLRVLDLGAGNGCVAEELQRLGVREFVGLDLHEEARDAARRDRPGLYDRYVVGDLLHLDASARRQLADPPCNALACVAALGFADIPPAVFAEAFNLVRPSAPIAFTIKEDFLDPADASGFSTLIRRMIDSGVLDVLETERYVHRLSSDGTPLHYVGVVGVKRHAIPLAMIPA